MAGVRSFEELMGRQAEAAVAISGADHSSYTRWTDQDPSPENAEFSATSLDGTIRYGATTLARLRRMFEPDAPRDDESLREYRHAVTVMLLRNAPLLSPAGRDYRDAPAGFEPWLDSADNQFSDAWVVATDETVDRYIDALGLDEAVPGIGRVRAGRDQIAEETTPGTEGAIAFAEHVAERSGARPDEVLRRIACETPAGKLPLAARTLFEAEGLDRVPAASFTALGVTPEAVQVDLERTLSSELAALHSGRPRGQGPVIAYRVGGPPPPQPEWPTPQGLVRTLRTAADSWRADLGAQQQAAPTADALKAVGFTTATPATGTVRAPAADSLTRPGTAAHKPPPDRSPRKL